MPPLVHRGVPEWVTPEIAEQMADQVLAAVKEAGYPDVDAQQESLFGCNWTFSGAPDDVLHKAGKLVRLHWGIDDEAVV